MAFDQSKFLLRFVEEAREHCSRISEGLLDLESSSGDDEFLNGLFRSAHTIKGSSRMMKLMGVTELANQMEEVLDAVRGKKIPLNHGLADLLFKGVDALLVMLEQIAAGQKSPDAPAALCEELAQAATTPLATEGPPATVPNNPPCSTMETLPPIEIVDEEAVAANPGQKKGQIDYLRINAVKLDDLIRLMGEIVSEHGRFRKEVWRLREIERSLVRHHTQVAACLDKVTAVAGSHDELKAVGEALRTTLQQSVRAIQSAAMMQDHLISDLQATSLKMRMLPLSTVFDPLRRTVRDLSHEVDKPINFVVEGGETELDRKIIDRIGDSLLHLIRNALDHGMESTAERIAAGKPAQGTIMLSAFYDSGCVTIALSDDGRGIAVDRIREKALAKRLFDAETLTGMSRSEIINLIFLPGFSTSPIITDLSGRGVGMDVVKKNIVDELKGMISVESKEGVGSTFLLRLPLNLAVFPLFQVGIAGKVFTLPATSIVEMLTARPDAIIKIVNKRALRLREQLIPIEDLSTILGLPRTAASGAKEVLIVIIRDGEEKLGMIVDEVIGREEMVVKSLPEHLQNLRLVSGVTIGERNSILTLLHVPELLKRAREIAEPERRSLEVKEVDVASILVVDDSYNTREIEKSILEAHGYLVDTAVDGEEGFEKTRIKQYDLVITDVEMPRLDGFSLTERLRADKGYHAVPIVIVTSREKDEDKKRGIRVGANAYIVKAAFDQSNLIETVRSLIG